MAILWVSPILRYTNVLHRMIFPLDAESLSLGVNSLVMNCYKNGTLIFFQPSRIDPGVRFTEEGTTADASEFMA